MFRLFLILFLTLSAMAVDNSPFEVRVTDPRFKLEDIKGKAQSEKENSNFELNVADIVRVKLDFELKNVTHQYEVGGIEWKASSVVINKIICKTDAEEVRVTQANVNVDAPFVRLRIKRPSTKHNKEAKKITILSKLKEPIEIPLPTKMEVLLGWTNGKPVITWPNPNEVKQQFMALAKDHILKSIQSSIVSTSNLPEGKEFNEGFAAYGNQLKQLLGDKVQVHFDRLPILKSVLEAILLQIAPTLQIAAQGKTLALTLEVKNNSLFISEKGKTYIPNLELKTWLAKKQETLINKVSVFIDSEIFDQNIASLVPENNLLPKFDKIFVKPLIDNADGKQYFDLNLIEDKSKKNILIRFEALENGLPKLVGNKEKLDQWLIASFVDQAIQAQHKKINASGLEFEGFNFMPSVKTIVLLIKIK